MSSPPSARELEILDAALKDAEVDRPLAESLRLFERLSAQAFDLVRHPWKHPGLSDDIDYPLTVGQLAKLVGVSPDQLRHWEKLDLLPTHRIGGRRLFFSAGAIHAFALEPLDPYQVGALGYIARGDSEAAGFIQTVAATIASVARRRAGQAASEVAEAADKIARHSGALASAKTRAGRARRAPRPAGARRQSKHRRSGGAKGRDLSGALKDTDTSK